MNSRKNTTDPRKLKKGENTKLKEYKINIKQKANILLK